MQKVLPPLATNSEGLPMATVVTVMFTNVKIRKVDDQSGTITISYYEELVSKHSYKVVHRYTPLSIYYFLHTPL